jgi:hypothetical protein
VTDFTANAHGQVWKGKTTGVLAQLARLPLGNFLVLIEHGENKITVRNGYGQFHTYERSSDGMIVRDGQPFR